jgi:hypothetical protein
MDTVGYGHTERLEQVIRPERQRAIVPVSLSIHNHRSRKRPVVFFEPAVRVDDWLAGSGSYQGRSPDRWNRALTALVSDILAIMRQIQLAHFVDLSDARPPSAAGHSL